jgi:hypothetical protein
MPRILLNSDNLNVEVSSNTTTSATSTYISDLDLLKNRSKNYIDILSKIDAQTLTATQGWNEVMDAIRKQFGTVEIPSNLLGIVARCYLGDPYEVHTLGLGGTCILKHFKGGESLPDDMEKARTLALHEAYAMVEVYKDKMLVVRVDGSVTRMDN